MKYRKLRIAWSVAWGVVAVLLCVLWVRSYWTAAGARCVISEQKSASLSLDCGRLYFHFQKWRNYIPPDFKSPRVSFSLHQSLRIKTKADDSSFGFTNNWGITELALPAWLVVLLPALLAATPWLHFRFSLRTLLIATTLVAALMGLVVWAAR